MNLSTAVFGIILLFFLWRGYQKGFIHSITRILSWVMAYPAAIFFTRPVADIIFQYSTLDGLVVYFIAGGLVFLLASFIVTQVIMLFSRFIPEEKLTGSTSKISGAIIGLIVGGFVGLLGDYAVNLVQTSLPAQSRNLPVAIPLVPVVSNESVSEPVPVTLPELPVKESFIDASAKKLVSAVTAKAIDLTMEDAVATQLSRDFTANPKATLGHMKELSGDDEIKALLADPGFQAMLSDGDVDTLLEDAEFQKLINNEHMQAIFANTGGASDGNSGDKPSDQVAAETIVKGWARAEALKNDPRVAEIMADPEFQQQITSANHLALLMNPQFKELTEIIVGSEASGDGGSEGSSENSSDESDNNSEENGAAKKADTPIFQWTDENGTVHFSDKPVNE